MGIEEAQKFEFLKMFVWKGHRKLGWSSLFWRVDNIRISTAESAGGQEAWDHFEAVTMTSPALSIDQRVREADLEKKENRE